jgi:hypothetical protein
MYPPSLVCWMLDADSSLEPPRHFFQLISDAAEIGEITEQINTNNKHIRKMGNDLI